MELGKALKIAVESSRSRSAKTLKEVRTALKQIDVECRVSSREGIVTFRTGESSKLDSLRATMAGLGFEELGKGEIEGSRWNWIHRHDFQAKD